MIKPYREWLIDNINHCRKSIDRLKSDLKLSDDANKYYQNVAMDTYHETYDHFMNEGCSPVESEQYALASYDYYLDHHYEPTEEILDDIDYNLYMLQAYQIALNEVEKNG